MHSKHRHRAARSAMHAALGGVLALTAAAAYAAAEVPPAQKVGTVEYRVGGIGATEAEAMRRLSSDYPLSLTFIEHAPDGRDLYTADVGVRVMDSDGNTRLDTHAQGPLLLADLPDGHYTVEATLGSDTRRRDVNIRDGKAERVVFTWPLQQADAREVSDFNL
jgi:hypothetical protein